MNRITQYAYDSKGNVTKVIYPDGSTTTYGTLQQLRRAGVDDRRAGPDHDLYV